MQRVDALQHESSELRQDLRALRSLLQRPGSRSAEPSFTKPVAKKLSIIVFRQTVNCGLGSTDRSLVQRRNCAHWPTAKLTREPEPVEVGGTNVLDAWRDWLADLAIPGSVVRDEVEKQGFVVPSDPLQLIVVGQDPRPILPARWFRRCAVRRVGRGRTCFTTRKARSSFGGMSSIRISSGRAR